MYYQEILVLLKGAPHASRSNVTVLKINNEQIWPKDRICINGQMVKGVRLSVALGKSTSIKVIW